MAKNILTHNGKILRDETRNIYTVDKIDGVKFDVGVYGGKDLFINGNELPSDTTGLMIDSYAGGINISNSAQDDEKINVQLMGYIDVNINDEHPYNNITSENLLPENIKKDINILGTTGTFEGGIDGVSETDTGIVLVATPKEKPITITGDHEEINVTQGSVKLNLNAYAEITLADNSEMNSIVTENLEPDNIKKDVTILGVTGTFEGGSGGNTLKAVLDATKNAQYLFDKYTVDNLSELIQYNDTENVTNFSYMFQGNSSDNSQPSLTFPSINTRNGTDFNSMFYARRNNQTFPSINTRNGTIFSYMYRFCAKATSFPALDVRNGTNLNNMYGGCNEATSILMYGMKVKFSIDSCTLLEAPALVTILSNCQVITSTQTLTLGSTLLAKLEGVYVKETGVEQYEGITCRPCVICESTDAGAMLATDYFTGKGWTLA